MTFVRTRLLLERAKPGQTLEILLKGGEPLGNVPRQIAAQGHLVVSLEPLGADAGPTGVHRLIVRKA